MVVQIALDCPHCSTKKAAFRVAYFWNHGEINKWGNSLAICAVCDQGIVLLTADNGSTRHSNFLERDVKFSSERFKVLSIWPEGALRVPENVPDNIASFYSQGSENLLAKRWDAAGSMFRKSLDIATKTLDPALKSLKLFHRIEKLHKDGLITDALRDWSHELRLEGNEAVHDDEPETQDDASTSQKFAEAFLTYTFTLPALVIANRKKREPA